MTGDNQHTTEVQFNSNRNSTTKGLAMDREQSESIKAYDLIVVIFSLIHMRPVCGLSAYRIEE